MNTEQFKELLEKAQKAIEGDESCLEAYVMVKAHIDAMTNLQGLLKDGAIDEASREDKKSFEKFGAKIQYREGSGRWNFKGLDDWTEKKTELDKIEEKHKAAYHAWKRGAISVDDETGEQIEPAGYTDGSPTISISIKKS